MYIKYRFDLTDLQNIYSSHDLLHLSFGENFLYNIKKRKIKRKNEFQVEKTVLVPGMLSLLRNSAGKIIS
jgi:hypothetical protein